MFPLAALADPPQDLALWIGGLVLAALGSAVGAFVARLFTRGDKDEAARKTADAEWKAELRSDLKRLLDGQQALSTTVQLQSKDLTMLATQHAALEKRQDEQARAHRESQGSVREENRAAVGALRDELRAAVANLRAEFKLRGDTP